MILENSYFRRFLIEMFRNKLKKIQNFRKILIWILKNKFKKIKFFNENLIM